jgi:Flp pilus assembly pilin Flp
MMMEREKMRRWKLYRDESGQDMVEYSLLMAFVCLASAALFIGVGKSVASIWGASSTSLSQAYSAANNSGS